jgi:hypothetical protein
MEDRQKNVTVVVVVVVVVDLLCFVLLLQNVKMFSGFGIYRAHLLHTAFSLDKDVAYPHTVYNENTTLFLYCRKNGCTVPK